MPVLIPQDSCCRSFFVTVRITMVVKFTLKWGDAGSAFFRLHSGPYYASLNAATRWPEWHILRSITKCFVSL